MDEELARYRADQAHAYLERIRRLGEGCAAMKSMVDDARERADGIRGIDYSAIRVQTSPTDDRMAKAMDEIRERIRDYVTVLAEYESERKQANDALLRMDDFTEATALRLRYILGWQWERICTEMHYTWDGMMSLRRRALSDYYDVMPISQRDPMHPAI